MSFHGRMPDGVETKSAKKYAAAWRAEAAAVEQLTGWRLCAFDPGLSFHAPTHRATRVVDVDLELARCITNAIAAAPTAPGRRQGGDANP